MKFSRIVCAVIGHDDQDKTPSHVTCARCGGTVYAVYRIGFGWEHNPKAKREYNDHGPSAGARYEVSTYDYHRHEPTIGRKLR